MRDFAALITAVLFLAIPLATVALASRRHHGPMPHPDMPAGKPWPPRDLHDGPLLWSLDLACGCVRFRRGEPVFLPCRRHEARLGRWSR